jgi:peptide/nickel transport system substrate-binding protein
LELLIGSGPYKLVSYVKEQGGYEYLYNEEYFLGTPRLKRLLLVPVSNAVAALERRDVDANQIPFEVIERFKQSPEFKVISGPSFWVLKLQFNDKLSPFDKKELRKAFAYAIDQKDLVKRATHSAAIPGNPGFLPPESEWYNPNVPQYKHNIEKAKELLAQIDIGNGKFELITPTDRSREAELIKGYLKDIGVEINIKALDMKTIDSIMSNGTYQMAITGHGGLGGEPSMVSGLGRDFRRGVETETEKDKIHSLAEQAKGIIDKEKRRMIFNEMQKIAAEEMKTIPLYYPIWYFVYRHKVFDGWFYTQNGISIGIPTVYNKLAFVRK